ncbi:right-handed parallel beta-helix repeat-containing protein [Fulvivirga ulvae]|uniref:right-handed parallel beta-helix repeat-containing protein n=1 Tax=Fulvivirga ulvae TaxID=2904245 RepID=UPI001F468F0D|nr:right-handed parallel beta-helix repeat-containing protein [Fulvivirga ulvae]UII32736.1 right-handed parallel beta-helix repeat-containing protein [Fulvivirga ulvae]
MKNIVPLLTLLIIITACGSDENVDVTRYELLPKTGVLANCTDVLASNKSAGFSFDNNSCQYSSKACADCDFIVEADMQIIDNNDLKLPQGAVIGIRAGRRNSLIFRNFYGTADKPYIITNCDGQVDIADNVPAIKLHTLSHVRLTGTGSTDDYGIKVSQGSPFGIVAELAATNFEIDHVEITNVAGPAISARTRPVCDGSTNRGTFTQKNTVVHHNYIHDVEGEGFYIGGSHWHTNFPPIADCPSLVLLEPQLEGVKVYNNIVENVGQDGIQVGGAVLGCEIYNNVVINYGLKNIQVHQSGIQINPGTTGSIFSNLIKGGTGSAIFINGFANKVFSNVIVDCARDGVHIGDREPPAGKSYVVVNNTMYNVGEYAIYMNSKLSINNVFNNNLLVNITGGLHNKLNDEISLNIDNNLELMDITEADLANPDQYDFSPTDNSSLIDAGITVSDPNVLADYMLNNRKAGQSIDIGAVEYQRN